MHNLTAIQLALATSSKSLPLSKNFFWYLSMELSESVSNCSHTILEDLDA